MDSIQIEIKYMKIGYYGYMHVPNNKGKMKNNGSRLQFQHKLYTIKTCIYKKLHKKSLNAITLDNWIFFYTLMEIRVCLMEK